MKTIKQLSTEFGISKEAIYKKLKFQLKNELMGHIFKVEGVTRIDEEGELLIKRSIHRERRTAIENVIGTVTGGVIDVELVEGQSPDGQAHLTEYVNLLREQVKEKDIQLETQSGHIGQLIRQLGFHQLLIQNKRVDEQFVTDGYDSGSGSGNNSGNNSIDITDALTPPVHKSFLGRIFRGRQKATR